MIRKNQGSNLVEYVIPIVLIGLVVGGAIYQLNQNDTLLNFVVKTCSGQLSGSTIVVGESNQVDKPLLYPAGSLSLEKIPHTTTYYYEP